MNIRFIFVSAIAVFAAIGLVAMLLTSPGQLVQQLVYAAVGAAVLFFLFSFFLKRRSRGPRREDRAYSKAVKQSKKKYASNAVMKPKSKTGAPVTKKKAARRKRPSHLTVIEGNKGKRGKRASSQ